VRLALLTFWAVSLAAQVHVSISQQGAQAARTTAGQLIKGVGIGDATICNRGSADVVKASGAVYDGIRLLRPTPAWKPLSTIAPDLASQVLDRQVSLSWSALLVDGGVLLAGAAGFAGESGAISMSANVAKGLTAAPQGLNLFKAFLAPRQPNDSTVKAGLLQSDLGLKAAGCLDRYFLYIYRGPWDPQEFTLP